MSVANLTGIQFIQDNASINQGFKAVSGIDFNTRYDFDLGDLGAWNAGVTGNYQLLASQQAVAGAPIISDFIGQNSGGRLRYRARLGWTDTEGPAEGLSVTGFLNFIPHSPQPGALVQRRRGTFRQHVFGAPAPPVPAAIPARPITVPLPNYPGGTPGLYTWDMSFGYTTGTRPANPYLQNLNFQFTVLDLFNKAPPFQYNFSSSRAVAAQIGNSLASARCNASSISRSPSPGGVKGGAAFKRRPCPMPDVAAASLTRGGSTTMTCGPASTEPRWAKFASDATLMSPALSVGA